MSIGNQHKDSEIQHFRLAGLILDQDRRLTAAALGDDCQKLFAHLLLRRIQPFLRQTTFQLRLDRVEFVEEAFLLQSSLGPVFVVVVMKLD